MAVHTAWPKPNDVLTHYERCLVAFELLADTTLRAGGGANPFSLMSIEAFNTAVREMKTELDQHCVMMLVASIEACFHVDLAARCERKLKDHCSAALRRLAKKHRRAGRRVEIEDVLDVWKTHVGFADAFGDFRQVIMYRHWLAHGRYWVQKSGLRNVDPLDVWARWEVVRDVISNTALFPL
jgi:hypothetical protein